MSDSKTRLLSLGMVVQGIGLLFFAGPYPILDSAIAMFGAGTALAYPNFISVEAENTQSIQRSQSLGIFRFRRNFGYVAGAIATGVFSDLVGLEFVLLGTTVLTIVAGALSEVRMCCTEKLL